MNGDAMSAADVEVTNSSLALRVASEVSRPASTPDATPHKTTKVPSMTRSLLATNAAKYANKILGFLPSANPERICSR